MRARRYTRESKREGESQDLYRFARRPPSFHHEDEYQKTGDSAPDGSRGELHSSFPLGCFISLALSLSRLHHLSVSRTEPTFISSQVSNRSFSYYNVSLEVMSDEAHETPV